MGNDEKRLGYRPRCEGFQGLNMKIAEIDSWAHERNMRVRYVSGLMATRKKGLLRKRLEVLLVKGAQKEFWQFPGGHVKVGEEDHVDALYRELKEELGVEPPSRIVYEKTYIPKPKPDAKEIYAIHAFSLSGCDWQERNLTLGSDVDQAVWTGTPLVEESGKPRILTEQVDHMLRHALGFKGPKNKNTCPDEKYDGEPDSLFLKRYTATYNPDGR